MWRCRSSRLAFFASASRTFALSASLFVSSPSPHGQALLDPSLLAPRVDGYANNPPRFGTWQKENERDASRFRTLRAQAGTGAGTTGFDSRNLKKRKAKPAQADKPAAAGAANATQVEQRK